MRTSEASGAAAGYLLVPNKTRKVAASRFRNTIIAAEFKTDSTIKAVHRP